MVGEEGMRSDFLRAVDTEALRRVACKKACKDAACFNPNIVTEDERVVQNLLVHDIGVLWCRGREQQEPAAAQPS